jgi:hypothetical protein
MSHDETPVRTMSLEEIKNAANEVAAEMKSAGDALPPALRHRFIDVRAQLFQRGYYDPVLVRFDSWTVPKAGSAEVAERLGEVAASL